MRRANAEPNRSIKQEGADQKKEREENEGYEKLNNYISKTEHFKQIIR